MTAKHAKYTKGKIKQPERFPVPAFHTTRLFPDSSLVIFGVMFGVVLGCVFNLMFGLVICLVAFALSGLRR